jgi:nucleoside-diphosphate-sugar epimerase
MKSVLVTGANGFVGSHTLKALGSTETRVIATVRDPRRLPADFEGEVRVGDLRDADFVARALEGVDAVCHCAAWTSAWAHAEESRHYYLEPTLGFLDAAVEAGVRRVVFPSSATARVLAGLPPSAVRGVPDGVWPHMANVVRIERHMEALADKGATMVALRLGLFVGRDYGLGMLPLLLPRLRTHLVPWVGRGRTTLPLVAGQDVGSAMTLAATTQGLEGYLSPDTVGPETPTAREVLDFLHSAHGYPRPHFGVSFPQAYGFARLMEGVGRLTRTEPFITRSIVLLLEETAADNAEAERLFGYQPQVHWQDAIRAQIAQMQRDRVRGLSMARPLPAPLPTTNP